MSSEPSSPSLIDLQDENKDHHQHTLRHRGETSAGESQDDEIATKTSLKITETTSETRTESPRKGSTARRERVLKYRVKHFNPVQSKEEPENDVLNADNVDEYCNEGISNVECPPTKKEKSFEGTKVEDSKASIIVQLPESNDLQSADSDTNVNPHERLNNHRMGNVELKEKKCEDVLELESLISEAVAQARVAVNEQDVVSDKDINRTDKKNRDGNANLLDICAASDALCNYNQDAGEDVHKSVILCPAEIPKVIEESQDFFSCESNNVELVKYGNDASCKNGQRDKVSGSGWHQTSIFGQLDTCAASNILCSDNHEAVEGVRKSVIFNPAEMPKAIEGLQEIFSPEIKSLQNMNKANATSCAPRWDTMDTSCVLDQLNTCAADNILCDDNHDAVDAVHNSESLNRSEMPISSSVKKKLESTKAVNATSCETFQSENGWDTRSILQYPLDSTPPVVSDLDSAWDASTPSFASDDQKAKSKPHHEVDISDSSSWKLNTAGFSDVVGNAVDVDSQDFSPVRALEALDFNEKNHLPVSIDCPEASNKSVHVAEAEKIEKEQYIDTTKGAINDVKIQHSNEENLTSVCLGWPASLDENVADIESKEPSLKLLSPKDDEALLEQIQERSDITALSKSDNNIDQNNLQKERINHYMSKCSDADSSSGDDEEADEISEQEDNNQEIQYMPCDGDENDILSVEDSSITNEPITVEHSSVSNHLPVVLDVAAIAAEAAENKSPIQACLDDSFANSQGDPRLTPTSTKEKKHTAGAECNTIDSLQIESDSLDKQPKKANIPLLPSPPKEKFKKWQESKRQTHEFFCAIDSCEERYNTVALLVPSESTQSEGNAGDEIDRNVEGLAKEEVAAQEPKAAGQVKQPRRQPSGCESIESFHDCYILGRNGSCVNDDISLSGDTIAEKIVLASSTTAELLEKSLHPENSLANPVPDNNLNSENEDNQSIFCGGRETLQKSLIELAGDSLARCDSTPTKETSCDAVLNDKDIQAPSGFASPSSGFKPVSGVFSSWTKDSATDSHCGSAASYNDILTSVTPLRAHLLPKSEINNKMSDFTNEKESNKIHIAANDDFLVTWLRCLLSQVHDRDTKYDDARTEIRSLLDENDNFDRLCAHVSMKVNSGIESNFLFSENLAKKGIKVKQIVPFSLANKAQLPQVLAANFVSFLQQIGALTGIDPPIKVTNPFLPKFFPVSIMEGNYTSQKNVQHLVFSNPGSDEVTITRFLYTVAQTATRIPDESQHPPNKERYLCPPEGGPSPFETATWTLPGTVVMILGMLGDPVAVCRMKMVNRFCNRLISENEHTVMRDAVRLGGMSMNIRPTFWMWITIENCGKPLRGVESMQSNPNEVCSKGTKKNNLSPSDLNDLAQRGINGKWHAVIERDVARAFGNMPPHKTGARLRADSIVKALVTFGRSRFLKRGVRGGGEVHPTPCLTSLDGQRPKPRSRESTAPPPWEIGDEKSNESERSESPTDTVSDWGGVSPVPSFSSVAEDIDTKKHTSSRRVVSSAGDESEIRHVHSIQEEISSACATNGPGQIPQDNPDDEVEELVLTGSTLSNEACYETVEELALSGNTLSNEMKIHLQNQLSIILHALAAQHEDVGYCQGLDYVVAHLLRVLQDTVKWREMKRSTSSSSISSTISNADDSAKLSVFRVMDCFFTTYNMKHMYYPELRSLKICCRVFEKLILLKLPVLADHFEHHELNVGLFALGWFQTLFLYLPSMPTATVCHMWDIWLVERSFKIFFRVGAAILFLSQPILLNHDLEGMMTYLNTFPDATLLKPDILIPCALQIKVTNRMLAELELEVTNGV